MSKFDRAGFLIIGLSFLCYVTLKWAQTSVATSRPYGANYYDYYYYYCCCFFLIFNIVVVTNAEIIETFMSADTGD